MNSRQPKRQRGVILTLEGLKKLQAAKSQEELQDNDGIRYTLERLSDRTGLDPHTLIKVFACEVGVDKRTLKRCFRAFHLQLETSDYSKPALQIEGVKTLGKIGTQENSGKFSNHQSPNFQDWGEAPAQEPFYGRTTEQAILRRWILEERCRLVMLLGMGGIGKTSLAVKLANQIHEEFEVVIWRSLLSAPTLQTLLTELLQFLSDTQETDCSDSVSGQISRLIRYLRTHRCLLIFDQVDAIVQGGEPEQPLHNPCAVRYRQGYEGYAEFFKRLGKVNHQSCLLLTSREKPTEIKRLVGETLSVQVLQLKGLQVVDLQAILKTQDSLWGSTAEWRELVEYYAGNPFALKLVSKTIRELFDGSIAEFLQQNIGVFGETYQHLDQQFKRLSELEKKIIHQLATTPQLVSFSQLREMFAAFGSPRQLLEAVESLQERSLIEKRARFFVLQPVLKEYSRVKCTEEAMTEVPLEVCCSSLSSSSICTRSFSSPVGTNGHSPLLKRGGFKIPRPSRHPHPRMSDAILPAKRQ